MTEKQKHTPGPWEVEGEGQSVVGILAVNDNHYICKLSGWESTTQDANAELIASAPQLKAERDEAIKALLDIEGIDKNFGNQLNDQEKVKRMTNRAKQCLKSISAPTG